MLALVWRRPQPLVQSPILTLILDDQAEGPNNRFYAQGAALLKKAGATLT
jgi:hypothetical protein